MLVSTFFRFLLSLFTRITSALFMYDKRTLLDIGHRCTNLLQDTFSTDPAWPLEILWSTELNKGHLNNPRRRRKHRGRLAGICHRLRERAHSPPLPSILLANVQSLENKMDDLRARISFQRDIRDCNMFILSYIYIYSLVLCFFFFFFYCPLSGPVLIYISLLIISCIIEYVTNKRTLKLEPCTFSSNNLK